jgi:hypothetical protein
VRKVAPRRPHLSDLLTLSRLPGVPDVFNRVRVPDDLDARDLRRLITTGKVIVCPELPRFYGLMQRIASEVPKVEEPSWLKG